MPNTLYTPASAAAAAAVSASAEVGAERS